MTELKGKQVAVIGGSRNVGRAIVEAMHETGAQVLAVARNEKPLAELAKALPDVKTLQVDGADDETPDKVFSVFEPDVFVMVAGVRPTISPLYEFSWSEFSEAWNVDVKASFQFLKASLIRPLKPSMVVILISSGVGLEEGSLLLRE